MKSPEQLREALLQPQEYYPRDLLIYARNQTEGSFPVLQNLLIEIELRPEEFFSIPSFIGLAFPMLILADCDDAESFPILEALTCLPEAQILPLWRGLGAQQWGLCLYRTAGERLAILQEMFSDPEISPWFRGALAEALVWAVADGLYPRGEALSFLAGHLTGKEAEADSLFWTWLAFALRRLGPEEVMPAISSAYVLGLIDRERIWPGAFDAVIAKGKEHAMLQLEKALDQEYEQDLDQKISAWPIWKTRRKATGKAVKAKKKRKKR